MKLLLINQSAQLDESNKQLVITFDFVDADGIVYRDTKYTPLPESSFIVSATAIMPRTLFFFAKIKSLFYLCYRIARCYSTYLM